MATGTGKTYTAFQIIWRLWKAKAKKRILFLADRNILVDQTMQQDFEPFGEAMHKITNREVKKNYEIYLALYQAVTGKEEWKQIYRQFSARLLRPDRHRRMPSRQRGRRLRLAGSPRLLQRRHPARPDRHAEGNEGRLEQHHLLRRAGLHLLAQARHRGWLPCALQGHPHRHRHGCSRAARPRRARSTSSGKSIETASIQHQGLRSQPGPRTSAPSWSPSKVMGVPQGHRPDGQDHRLLRRP